MEPQALGSCPGQLPWGSSGCSAPHGPEDSNANSSVHATNLKTLTQNPPFVAQSHLCSKPAGVGHVSSPGSDFQVPRCEGIPVLGLGMALSSPCHRPLVGKDRTKPCLPPCAGLRELSCRPQGGAGRGKETPRKSGGMRRAAHPTGMEAKHLPQPGQPCPREGPRADRHPNPP